MNFESQRTVQSFDRDGVLARNKVLRQTYTLLGMNVLFSAFCAYIGMLLKVNVPFIVSLLVILGLPMAISAKRNSGVGIVLLFVLTGFLGFYVSNLLSMLIAVGRSAVVVKALIGTAVIFFSLSAYVLLSGKDFSFLGGFLFVGMLIVLLAALGSMFFGMTLLNIVCSALFILIFSGYVLYDTSRIINGGESNYIIATLTLFMDIFNIFLHLINLISSFSGE
ncbi:Bax inhibitor-1/YccA family protein [Dichelobacter nodosus]|uniref:Conserved hypothetical membrane protein n=1 Tax=Dichelobacter nodosus (strain VCS1703A) TaxID=246195 RepID=A5EVN6_DICNV|nr:Bax inhibitor-1/YccA family protein [Dichelobacter nodosus]ABQ14008.1 conserved hypothetical membrane protein [Dichelobacter nodosus VCS1703A]AXM45381.1 BAX inhibitor (BI)-1/YccA family protein [Dichelobacter nodosus]KNZ39400.1 membrane protein [Dichelobacter nodosus]TGA65007.1 Bax inhibitor-1/YccA family protein [Dichelobacter nodosus]